MVDDAAIYIREEYERILHLIHQSKWEEVEAALGQLSAALSEAPMVFSDRATEMLRSLHEVSSASLQGLRNAHRFLSELSAQEDSLAVYDASGQRALKSTAETLKKIY